VDFGVDDAGIKLARLRVSGLGRDYVWRMVREGFASPSKIKDAKLEELQRVIPETVARRLKEAVEQRPKPSRKRETLAGKSKGARTEEMSLVIDGSPVKDRFLVLVNGRKTILPAKSFKYLVKLVWAAFKTEDGWIHKNDFEPGENQTRYLYRLRKQIKPGLDPGQFMIENNRLGSYRLSIPKHRIAVNSSALLKNPDAEIKTMADEFVKLMSGVEKPVSHTGTKGKTLSRKE
jgi:hypothetical protein